MIVKHSRLGIQRRKIRRDGWTTEKRAKFLDVLAVTCNATTAAKAVGKWADSARALKRRDGEFARLWAEAMAQGSERLEEELIACALGQIPSGYNPTGDRQEPPVQPFDPDLAIQILKMRSGTHPARKRTDAPPAQDDVDVALIERLEGLAKTLAAK